MASLVEIRKAADEQSRWRKPVAAGLIGASAVPAAMSIPSINTGMQMRSMANSLKSQSGNLPRSSGAAQGLRIARRQAQSISRGAFSSGAKRLGGAGLLAAGGVGLYRSGRRKSPTATSPIVNSPSWN